METFPSKKKEGKEKRSGKEEPKVGFPSLVGRGEGNPLWDRVE